MKIEIQEDQMVAFIASLVWGFTHDEADEFVDMMAEHLGISEALARELMNAAIETYH